MGSKASTAGPRPQPLPGPISANRECQSRAGWPNMKAIADPNEEVHSSAPSSPPSRRLAACLRPDASHPNQRRSSCSNSRIEVTPAHKRY
ncbi:hypothetical protein PIB30_000644 [Stylosanthes scabra]|uniref:Uncharacterized protein n=1 Tax=Stylosanthes scabra TaxID=79078 RepID=A0ABU6Y0Q3_9FABA|nr:hypothetical protein [Stylosanthes scabra]